MQVDRVRLDAITDGSSRGSATRASATSRSTGSTDAPEQLGLAGVRVSADLPRWADFRCSDSYLERFHAVMVRTLDNNLVHIPTDTPTYEKNGWTGDAQTALPAILTSYDAEAFLTKWLGDLRDAQRPDGWLPVIAPTPGLGIRGVAVAGVDHRLSAPAVRARGRVRRRRI